MIMIIIIIPDDKVLFVSWEGKESPKKIKI